MSRDFNGSSQYGSLTLTFTATPCTIAAWVKTASSSGSGKTIVALGGNAFHYHLIGQSTALGKWYVGSRDGGSERYAASTTTPSTSVWVHVCGVFGSTTSRIIYINGASEGSDANSVNPTVTKLGVGVRVDGAIPAATPGYFTGQVRDAAVWGVALSAAQIASLAKGANPLIVAPASLAFFTPLVGEASPEPNMRGISLTLAGTAPRGASDPALFPP